MNAHAAPPTPPPTPPPAPLPDIITLAPPPGPLVAGTGTAMTAFPQIGTRLFWWDVNGSVKYGTTVGTARMVDGTMLVEIQQDGAVIITLPVSSVSKVT
jgi:hypothetical protein